ncbi:DNA sulfur modification protein DndB [Bacillus aerolatus]|uniref:DNA sulfur modification protein DndB n=1 Tax=Bacillus aerolatus TaxID=2653354 RepID=A0A6I1FG61_9BACI|nr:DNA sulfur modification protein DndB [Bacillus aerolatus]KAB7707120.1 DNA sulfur modification protein DndB [Bacillus aerolatus]
MEAGFNYNFPAIRGYQAGKEYYIAMCPLKIIPRLFLFDEDEIPPEHRAQRILNKSRIPDITNYIVENRNDYVFSSLTASVDGEIHFTAFSEEPGKKDIGNLSISLDSRFLINDGQHRRAAIEEALKIQPDLGNETISVVFYHDTALKRSQQIFSDLNRHAVNTTSSIGILYDHRDKMSLVTKLIVEEIAFLRRYTDKEKVSLSKNSPKIVALNHIYNTNLRLLNIKKGDLIVEGDEQFLIEFWNLFSDSITEWKLIMNRELTPKELRMSFIVGHGVFLESIGIVGHYLRLFHFDNWKSILSKLQNIDWSRSNHELWLGRAFNQNGRIQKNSHTVMLTAIQIKKQLGLALTEQEQRTEESFQKGRSL